MQQIDWAEYYALTKGNPPSKLLGQALPYVEHKGSALDVGAGALRDSKFLLQQGFEVTALDADPLMEKEARKVADPKLHVVVSPYIQFDFGAERYDLIVAMNSLPFETPEFFDELVRKIQKALKRGGIVCANFFGLRDEWSASRPGMTFRSAESIKELFAGYQILYWNEEEKDGTVADGSPKHWHVLYLVVKKP